MPLERDVVDGIDGAYVFVKGKSLVELAQEHGCHGGMPVVAVENVAHKAVRQVLQGLADGFGEECEALAIVKKAIRIVALKIVLVVYKEIGDAVVHQALKAAVLVAPAQGHVKVGDMFHLAEVGAIDRGVFGHHHDDFCSRCL